MTISEDRIYTKRLQGNEDYTAKASKKQEMSTEGTVWSTKSLSNLPLLHARGGSCLSPKIPGKDLKS